MEVSDRVLEVRSKTLLPECCKNCTKMASYLSLIFGMTYYCLDGQFLPIETQVCNERKLKAV